MKEFGQDEWETSKYLGTTKCADILEEKINDSYRVRDKVLTTYSKYIWLANQATTIKDSNAVRLILESIKRDAKHTVHYDLNIKHPDKEEIKQRLYYVIRHKINDIAEAHFAIKDVVE